MENISVFEQIKNSQFTRLIIVIFLIIILQIPTAMLQGIISERQNLKTEATQGITSTWGTQQLVVGPKLMVPYVKKIQEGDKVKPILKHGVFLPETLDIHAKLDSKTRYRGIFEIPVYDGHIDITGQFKRPDLAPWGVQAEDIQWDNAELVVEISDAHAIKNQVKLDWNKKAIDFQPGLGKFPRSTSNSLQPASPQYSDRNGWNSAPPSINGNNLQVSGVHARLKGQMTGETFDFKVPLKLSGSEKIQVAPLGQLSKVTMSGNWLNPSFQGRWLPIEREVNTEGFSAKWEIPALGRNYPQSWNQDAAVEPTSIDQSAFGVDLLSPVDNYRLSERSIKYNFLFLVLMFAIFWMFEVIAKLRLHPLQYLIVGVAMSLFYLLQLALSEHIGFQWAYWIASAGVTILITTYSVAVLSAKRRGGIVGVVQVALYVYLYVVLANQDYSLLIGSIGLFIFLAIIMYLTRQVNWFDVGPKPKMLAESESQAE
jgi:inner membrane protein